MGLWKHKRRQVGWRSWVFRWLNEIFLWRQIEGWASIMVFNKRPKTSWRFWIEVYFTNQSSKKLIMFFFLWQNMDSKHQAIVGRKNEYKKNIFILVHPYETSWCGKEFKQEQKAETYVIFFLEFKIQDSYFKKI